MRRRRASYPLVYPFIAGGPEASGLVWWTPMLGASLPGGGVRDLRTNTVSALVNSATIGPIPGTSLWGLNSTGNDMGTRIACPPQVRNLNPVTYVWIGFFTGTTATNQSEIFGSHVAATAAPYVRGGIGVQTGGSTVRGQLTNGGGGFVEVTANAPMTSKNVCVLMFAIRDGLQHLYVNGRYAAGGGTTFTGGGFVGTEEIGIGTMPTNLGRNAQIRTVDTRIYNRFFSEAEALALWNNGRPWGLYQSLGPDVWFASPGAAAAVARAWGRTR